MAVVALSRGYFATVDDSDLEIVSNHKWHVLITKNGYIYAITHLGTKKVLMHRMILGAPAGMEVDHADHDGLNNSRSNIRLATRSQNARNQNRPRDNRSGYKGVRANGRQWQASIILPNRKFKHLGLFKEKEVAALAYNFAAMLYFGEYARLNEINYEPKESL